MTDVLAAGASPRPTRERRAGRVYAPATIVLRRYYVGNGLDRSEKNTPHPGLRWEQAPALRWVQKKILPVISAGRIDFYLVWD